MHGTIDSPLGRSKESVVFFKERDMVLGSLLIEIVFMAVKYE